MHFISLLILASSLAFAAPKPTATHAVLHTTVSNFNNTPQKAFIQFTDAQKNKTFTDSSNAQGAFSISLPKGAKYYIHWLSLTGPFLVDSISIPPQAGEGSIQIQFDDATIELEGVFFSSGKASLDKRSHKALSLLTKGLKSNPKVRIEIAGHTDDQGDITFNQKLSQDRAESVINYLVSKGIPPKRLIAKGYGPSQPVATNDTPEGRSQNRRTEVRILTKK